MLYRKLNKPNPYANFVQVMKPLLEERVGRTLSHAQLTPYLKPAWNIMSAEEKALFVRRKSEPLDSYGTPLSVHAEMAERAQKITEDMIAGISNMIDLHVTAGALTELGAVVVAVTDYATTDEGQVIPAEVSLVRLTLGGGLDPRQYHAIINPPPTWPLGYAASTRTRAEATHRLPIDRRSPDCVGTDSLQEVGAEMVAFLTQRDGSDPLCPVFTMAERLNITRTTFRDSFGIEHVNVWCLEDLLRAAYRALKLEDSNFNAYDALVNDPKSPDFHPALGCQWHREEHPDSVNFCSLNMAQRWGFMLLKALSVDTSLGVTLVAGRHWAGPNRNTGKVIHLGTLQQKRNIRRHVTSMQTINTASEGLSDRDSHDISVDSRAQSSKSRREKTWQEIEAGPKTPVIQSSEEFPSLGGGRKQAFKNNGRGGASGFSRGARGGPNTARTKAGEGSASSNGTGGRVSIKAAAACLVPKSEDSLGRSQQSAAVRSPGAGSSSCTTIVEEQLRHVSLNRGPSRIGEPKQQTAAFVEDSKKKRRGRKK